MDYVNKMQNNTDSINVQYLLLLQKYSNEDKSIYGFVEGIEDISFYQSLIDPILPETIKLRLNKIGDPKNKGGKENVIKLYNAIDWNTYSKKRILFFVDRDLSEIINDSTPIDDNIYITDDYSIENHVVSSYTLRRLLKEIYELDILQDEIMGKVICDFEAQKCLFCEIMSEVMANIIFWKKTNVHKPNYNNIKLDKLLSINPLCVSKKMSKKDFTEAIYSYSNVNLGDYYNENSVSRIQKEFIDNGHHHRFIRGKFMMWYFIEFTRSVTKGVFDFNYLSKDCGYKIKQVDSNAFFKDAVVRCKIPITLELFMKNKLN